MAQKFFQKSETGAVISASAISAHLTLAFTFDPETT